MRPTLALVLLVCSAGTALGEDSDARARDELERALREMVKLPPATLEVVFDGIDSTRYKLLEGSFALDERPIPMPAGSSLIFAGEIQPGRHTLSTTLVYEAPSPTHGSIKYKVPGKFIFTAQRGVLMRVRARIEVDDGAEPAKRLQLLGQAETDLRAKLEEPPPAAPEQQRPEMADAVSKQKRPTSADASEPSPAALGSRQPTADFAPAPAIPSAVLKQKVAHRKPTSPVADEVPPAPAAPIITAVEKPAETPSPAPVAGEQRPPARPAPPAAPPPVSTETLLTRVLGYLHDFGTAIAGSAMAVIGGLLLLAVVRKRR